MSAELRGRVLLYGGVGGLLVLTLAPLLLPDVGGVFAPLLERCRELLAHCLLALRAAGAPLYWLPILLLVGGTAYASIDRVRVWIRLDRLLAYHSTRLPYPDEPIGRLAREFGLGRRVRVLVGLAPNPAFTVGVLRPRVYIAEELQQTLTPLELRAVFRHELYHLRRHDPLRFAVLRFLSKSLFWLPLLRVWIEELMEAAELMADDFAAARSGGVDPLDVASALIALGRANERALTGAVSIGGFRLLDRRVRRLAGVPIAVSPRLPIRPALLSFGALAIFWTLSLLSPPSAHALPTMHAHEPCPHGVHAGPHEHCPRCDRPHLATHSCRT
jgi:Zn-dependent protease with chaperone function